jgi:segregation and condensation protein A
MLLQKQQIEAATWTNPAIRQFSTEEGAEPEIAADTVDLVRVFREILDRARQRPVLNVDEEAVTVSQMLDYVRRRLIMEERPVSLSSLLRSTRSERALICMFLALLELVRLQAILLRQDRNFGEVYIKKHASFESIVNQGLQAKDDWR